MERNGTNTGKHWNFLVPVFIHSIKHVRVKMWFSIPNHNRLSKLLLQFPNSLEYHLGNSGFSAKFCKIKCCKAYNRQQQKFYKHRWMHMCKDHFETLVSASVRAVLWELYICEGLSPEACSWLLTGWRWWKPEDVSIKTQWFSDLLEQVQQCVTKHNILPFMLLMNRCHSSFYEL